MNFGRLVKIGCFLCLCTQAFASPLLNPLFGGAEDLVNLKLDFADSANSVDISDQNPFGSATSNISLGSGSSTLGWHESFSFTGNNYTGFWEFDDNISTDLEYTPGDTKAPLVSVRVVYFQMGYQDFDAFGSDNPVKQKPTISVPGGNLALDYGFTVLDTPNSRDAWVLYQTMWELPVGTNNINVAVLAGANGSIVDQVLIDVVPEPATLILLAFGGLAAMRKRRC